MMIRRAFLKCSAAAAAGAAFPALAGADEPVRLKAYEIVEFPNLSAKRRRMMKVTGSNGAIGYSRAVAADLKSAAAAAGDANLLDHDALWERLRAANVPKGEIATLDIAAWDLHARMLKKPLHAMLGTKKAKILRYGDVRGQQPDFSPQKYADNVARYLDRTGMLATKLHFPGNMGTAESISFSMILETLQAVRKAVGKDRTLAWDPYPGTAESAT
jgi:L-alanine-DL-glutamate epimerase-like enolase superfamily enzyme